ncbi:MAG: c-type cytochrome [Chromatiales bacterium]|nr:c-type cytochrome [Chromatiales bacterium]
MQVSVVGAALLGLGTAVAQAAGVDAGKLVREGNGKGAVACVSCHGTEGAGQAAAGFPRLAGLDGEYRQSSYATSKRASAIIRSCGRSPAP